VIGPSDHHVKEGEAVQQYRHHQSHSRHYFLHVLPVLVGESECEEAVERDEECGSRCGDDVVAHPEGPPRVQPVGGVYYGPVEVDEEVHAVLANEEYRLRSACYRVGGEWWGGSIDNAEIFSFILLNSRCSANGC